MRYATARRLLPLLVPLFSVAIYLNTLDNEFVKDDYPLIVQNELIRDASNVPRIFLSSAWAFLSEEDGGSDIYYRPLLHLNFMVGYKLSGLEPWGHHAVSIALHSINSMLVFLVASLLLGQLNQGQGRGHETASLYAKPAPFFAALLFAAHPSNTEAVSWPAAGSELLLTMFFLAGLYLYAVKRHVSSAAMFFLSILSKETSAALLVLFPLYDMMLGGPASGGLRGCLKRCWPHAAAILSYIGLRIYVMGWSGASLTHAGDLSTAQYLMNSPLMFIEFMKTLFLPTELVFFTNLRFEPLRSFDAEAFFALSVFASIALLFLLAARVSPLLGFSGIWVVVPLLPPLYLGWLLRTPMYADRYLYLSSAGFSIFVAASSLLAAGCIASMLRPKGSPPEGDRRDKPLYGLAAMLLAVVVALYGMGTVKRNETWQSAYTIWKDTVAKAPSNITARHMYAIELSKRGLLDEALRELSIVIKAEPNNATAHYNRAVVLAKKGLMDEAVAGFEEALILNPDYRQARESLERARAILQQADEGR